jgi:c-di-GMP-binding flagellar brake protein YcgR
MLGPSDHPTLDAYDRRLGSRLPYETYLTTYIDDRPARGFTMNLSETGLYVSSLVAEPLPPLTPVGIEIELPGQRDTIWAAGEIRHDELDDYFSGRGIRFTAMACLHERLLRNFCFQLRCERMKARLLARDAAAAGRSSAPLLFA